jgi:hypothetical protein
MAPIEVPTAKIIWLLSSNKADVSPDLAARALITRMRKQPNLYQFKVFGDGRDLLQEVRHKCPYYLSCALAIIREWVSRGRPRTSERRHDFTEVCQSLDWIVQNILKCAPLLDDHQNEQQRISNPLINFLRDVAIIIEKNDNIENWLRASEISQCCIDNDISIPQCRDDADDKSRNQTVGRILKNIFKDAQVINISGFTIERQVFSEYDPHMQKNREVTRYLFNK